MSCRLPTTIAMPVPGRLTAISMPPTATGLATPIRRADRDRGLRRHGHRQGRHARAADARRRTFDAPRRAHASTRDVFRRRHPGRGGRWISARVFERGKLLADNVVEGPAGSRNCPRPPCSIRAIAPASTATEHCSWSAGDDRAGADIRCDHARGIAQRPRGPAQEMGGVLKLTSFSPNIKERMDASCAIFVPSAARRSGRACAHSSRLYAEGSRPHSPPSARWTPAMSSRQRSLRRGHTFPTSRWLRRYMRPAC